MHRRRSRRVGRQRQNARLRQHTATARRRLDPHKILTLDSGDAIVLGQRGIYESKIGIQEIEDAAIFSDNGCGIELDVLPRIFDLFVTTKPPGRGTGLGLVICQEIIRAHGGTINIVSEVGQGTTVSIYLPVDARPAVWPMNEESHEHPHLDRG